MLKLAKGDSIYQNRIRLHEYTISQLFHDLKSPEVRRKKDGPYFILAEFKNLQKPAQGEKFPHSIRNAENLIRYFGAVIDLDDAKLDISEIGPLLPPCKYFIYTTYSHQLPEKFNEKGHEPQNRYRLVIPYDAPQKPTDHKLLVAWIASHLGLDNVDISSDSISRGMYLPSCHPSNREDFAYEIKVKAPLLRTTLTAQEKFEIQELIDESKHESEKRFDINLQIYEGEGRNDAACKLVGKLIHTGMDNDTLVRATEAWNEANCIPPLPTKELHTVIKSIIDGHTKRSNKWGYDELKRQISEATPDDFEYVLKLIATADSKQVTTAKREILIRDLSRKVKLPIGTVREELKQHELLEEEIETEEQEKHERKTVKELRQEFRDWCYVASIDKVYNFKNRISYRVEGFNRMHQSKLDRGTVLPLLLKYNCIQQADRLEFAPGEPFIFTRNFTVYANTYLKPNLQPIYSNPKIMLDHFRKLIPDKDERTIILDFISHLVQHPGKKILFMPIIKGKHGIGKSIIAEKIIPAVLGEQNVRGVKSKKIHADFNSWALDTQLVVFHELKIGTTRKERLDLTEDLKDIITELSMLASKKGIDDYDTRNNLNLIGFTNHEDAIMIPPSERRFFMIRSEMKSQSIEYYNTLHTWIDENPESIYHYFLNRDISDFNPHFLPESKYTREIKKSSYMWPQSIIAEALADKENFMNQIAVSWNAVVNYIRENSTGKDALECENLIHAGSSQAYKLINALKESGFRKYEARGTRDPRIRINKRLETVWLTPTGVDKKQKRQISLVAIKKCLIEQQRLFEFDGE